MSPVRGVGVTTKTRTPISENERKGCPLIFKGHPFSANIPFPRTQRELEEHLNFCHHISTGIQIFKGRGQVPLEELKQWHDESHNSEFKSGLSHTHHKVIEKEIETETEWQW